MFDMQREIAAFRAIMRSKEYLSHPQLKTGNVLSLSGAVLDIDLVHPAPKSCDKRAQFYTQYMDSEVEKSKRRCHVAFTIPPVCVTKVEREEYELVENKPIADIELLIEGLLLELDDEIR